MAEGDALLEITTGVMMVIVFSHTISQIYPSGLSFCTKFMRSLKSLCKKRTKTFYNNNSLILTTTKRESYLILVDPVFQNPIMRQIILYSLDIRRRRSRTK
jgi:hypothetical protein